MKVLITGASGAVGQYILERLLTIGHAIRVLALPDSMHRINFRDRIEVVPGGISDETALAEACAGVDLVFHTAMVGPPPQMRPETLHNINVDGTRKLLAACRGSARRMVMVTTNNIYALHRSPAMWPLLDDAPRHAHGNPAQVALNETLIEAEDVLIEAGERNEIEYAILRPTAVAGRKCPAIEAMVTTVLRTPERIERQRRVFDMMQWTHGSDVASAALRVAEADAACNQCFLVANSEPITLYDVQKLVWDIMNPGQSDNPHEEIASRNNMGVPKREPRKLAALGWKAEVDVKQMIAEVLGRLEFYSSESLAIPAHLLE